MSPDNTLALVKQALAKGMFQVSKHAIQREGERAVTTEDICNVGRSGSVFRDEDEFVITGLDTDNQSLIVVATPDGNPGLYIVTVKRP